jgi:ribulose-5-phosphate 4-epimerase/fuculose-1-phosphate aldolase
MNNFQIFFVHCSLFIDCGQGHMGENGVGLEIIRVCRILDKLGLVAGFGHVSVRLDTHHMLITPARAPGLATVDDLFTFTLAGELVAGPSEVKPPLERWLHLAIYARRPEVRAICRTHSRMAAVLGVANQPLQPAHGLGGMLGLEVPVYPENDLVTNEVMGQAVAATLADHGAVLLRGNGAVVTGGSLPQACVRAIYLEEAAWLQVMAAGVGGAMPFTATELTARSRWYPNELERAWEYYRARYEANE